jgi:hypothetical protein
MPLDHARLLLTTLHPRPSADALVEITALLATRKRYMPVQRYFTDIDVALEWAFEKNAEGWSIFHGVNPRRSMGSFEANVGESDAFFVDLQPERTSIADTAAMLTRFGIPPSIQVCSGNGAHFYLLLHPSDPMTAKPIAKRLCGATGSDAVFNVNRIARIPGSVNWKPPPKQPTWCYLTDLRPERRYTLAQVDAALDAMGAPSVKRQKERPPHEPENPPQDWWELKSRLSPHACAIVDFGERNPYSEKQVSRSEADWFVICSLVRADATDEMIKWVYDTQPVGLMKYHEAGPRYLAHTTEAARRSVASAPTAPNAPGERGRSGGGGGYTPRYTNNTRYVGGARDQARRGTG